MSTKIAPTLQELLREPVKGVPMLAAYHGRVAVRELRALLAVARAAKRTREADLGQGYERYVYERARLDGALRRLSTASGARRKG